MNDLGFSLAWLAVQVALVLVPALIIQTLATRRNPVTGAWLATLSLGLAAILGLATFLPAIPSGQETQTILTLEPDAALARSEAHPVNNSRPSESLDPSSPSPSQGPTFGALRSAWSRFEHQAAVPARRIRPWGQTLAVVALVGSGVGLLRFLVGLWAVGLCRRKGRIVEDAPMIGLVEELRGLMGCGPSVEILEVADLSTPATAGWWRPMLLLPDDWRAWDDSERRAVVAHELAHIVRRDYAAGLLARLTVVMHAYHPLVYWMAARLHLQQELAADALGARFAGGRTRYLVALASLALKQDGRSPGWPARAFLPSRGTLIRRIKMLKNGNDSRMFGQDWSKVSRLATALGLLALTMIVASWKAPAEAQDTKLGTINVASGVVRREPTDPQVIEPFEVDYISDQMMGVVAFRPGAISRRIGTQVVDSFARAGLGGDFSMLAKTLGVDMSRPGFINLKPEDIESISCGFKIGTPPGAPKNDDGEPLQSIEFGGVTVRTVQAFDWPAFLRQWTVELEEVRHDGGVYFKPKDLEKAELLMGTVLYQPNNRTLVLESDKRVKEFIARKTPKRLAYLQGEDWNRVSRSLFAVAINNQGEKFAKGLDKARSDEKVVLDLFKGIDRWMISLADADPLVIKSEVTGIDPKAAEGVARSIRNLANLAGAALNLAAPSGGTQDQAVKMSRTFLENLKINQQGTSITITVENFMKLTDLVGIIKAQLAEGEAEALKTDAKEVEAKKVKR